MEIQDFNVDFLQSNSHMMMSDNPFMDQGFNVDDLLGDENLGLFTAEDDNLPSLTFLEQVDSDDTNFEVENPEAMFSTKNEQPAKSPWHESDSGVSDSSFVGSPVDPNTLLSEVSLVSTTQNILMAQQPNMMKTGMNENAGMHCPNNVGSLVPAQRENEADEFSSCGRPIRKCSRRKVSIQVDHSDSEDSNSGDSQFRENKRPITIQPLNYYNDAASFARKDVKIVKVIKPPAGAADGTDEDIVKALEERSKKNAQQAKINREKKKAYIKDLEDEVEKLKKANRELTQENGRMQKILSSSEEEIEYLKSVLANASALSGLLKNISNVKEVKLSASISSSRKRGSPDDHSYNMMESVPQKRARLVKENLKKAGVCLHVSDGEACLEFCAHCSSLAEKTHGRRGKS